MSNTINIPVQLRQLTGGREHVKIDLNGEIHHASRNLQSLINLLEFEAPGMQSRLLDQDGKLRKFVNIFIDGQDCRTLRDEQAKKETTENEVIDNTDPLDLQLTGCEEITILPAIAVG